MSLTTNASSASTNWKEQQKIALRFFFIYFVIQIIPLDWKYYVQLFQINWFDFYYGDLFNLSRYYPKFLSGPDTYWNWIIAAILAIIGTVIWGVVEKRKQWKLDYNGLYYWLRVIVRYRLAVGVIAYGFLKLFLLQAPFPSISNLNTNYGDFTTWKLFTLSLGAAPIYEIFLGVIEILAGVLLLFRRTATIGAFTILCFTGNVFLSNLAYEGGEHIYSLYLVVLALFLFAFDAQRLVNLLSLEKPTEPNTYKPVFTEKWKYTARLAVKSLFIFVFFLLYGFKANSGAQSNNHNIPATPGLANAAGLYNVKDFVIKGDTLAYSRTDSVRWNDVVFEKWATISIRSQRPVIIDSTNVEYVNKNDNDKVYELSGSAQRHYYSYVQDTVNNVLILHNKNKHYQGETLKLQFSRPNSKTIKLSGLDQNQDSIQVTLEKIDKKYLLIEGRRKPQKL